MKWNKMPYTKDYCVCRDFIALVIFQEKQLKLVDFGDFGGEFFWFFVLTVLHTFS